MLVLCLHAKYSRRRTYLFIAIDDIKATMIPLSLLLPSLLCLTTPSLASSSEPIDQHGQQWGWPTTTTLKPHDHRSCSLALDDSVGPLPSSWAPWTHRPYCADTSYCVFTNSNFRGNHGVSIITTSEIAAASPNLLAKLTSSQPGPNQTDAPHIVREVPGKGKGLFATRRIARGELFMEDYPSVLADLEFPGKVKREQGQLLLDRAIGQLAQAKGVLGLAGVVKLGRRCRRML